MKGGDAMVSNLNPITTEVVTNPDGTTRTINVEELGDGSMIYLDAESGEEVKGINFANPHPNVEAFIARIERRAISAVGWFYELIYLDESGRAAMRLVAALAKNAIWKQQRLGERRALRALRYALAKAQKNGFLSRNPDPRDAYFSWEFGLPEELSVDQGNDEQADRENLKMGTTCKEYVAAKKGRIAEVIDKKRDKEIRRVCELAAGLMKDYPQITDFNQAYQLYEQRSPNPTPSAAAAAEPDEPTSTPADSKKKP
jgi:hypothetical protein